MTELADHIGHLTTSGIFSLDGQDFEVENNVWLVGSGDGVIVVDAPHSASAILDALGSRRVRAVVATHGHNDHVNAAAELAAATAAPVLLHPDDLPLWRLVYGDGRPPDGPLRDGEQLSAGDVALTVLHTPGHTPGGCCLYWEEGGVLFSGDTLFNGGPGATGRSFSDFPTIISSIRDRLLSLPPETLVLAGHGASTTIGEEAPRLEEWIRRGH